MRLQLNIEQQKIVEEHISVVHMVIRKCIMINESIEGMGYEDVFQIGCIGLCKAAVSYQMGETASFQTYAFSVVRNEIYNHVKAIARKQKNMVDIGEEAEFISPELTPEEHLEVKTAMEALQHSKRRYTGVAKCGIEALELKLKGYTGAEIAELYEVKPNYIAACICRAVKYLRQDRKFFADLGREKG